MNIKYLKIIDVFVIFGLCLLTHYIYTWFPINIFSIFFPVNESIWEHMKMLFSAIIINGFFDHYILKHFKLKYNNFFVNLFLTSTSSIIIFLIIYIPLFYIFGNQLFINFIVLIISIIISQIISYAILKTKDYNRLNIVCIFGIIFTYIIFGILTYYPIENDIFYDFSKNKYGINIYDI